MPTGLLTPTYAAILLIVALLILGPTRLPAAGRALGTGIREFKDAITGRDRAREKHAVRDRRSRRSSPMAPG